MPVSECRCLGVTKEGTPGAHSYSLCYWVRIDQPVCIISYHPTAMRSHVHIYLCVRNADDPFCSRAVAKPTKKPASLAPEQFYCGNSAKYSNNVIQFGDSKQRCGALVDGIKDVWTVFRREVGNPEFELFFNKCCARTSM